MEQRNVQWTWTDMAQNKKYLKTIHNTLSISFSLKIITNPTYSDLLIKCQKIMRPAEILQDL